MLVYGRKLYTALPFLVDCVCKYNYKKSIAIQVELKVILYESKVNIK